MTKAIVLQPSGTSVHRQQPLLNKNERSSNRSIRAAEVAGGTAAECVAVVCCCPCTLLDIIVLTVYKVPTGLCRKAIRRKRLSMLKEKGLLPKERKLTRTDSLFQIDNQAVPVSVLVANAAEPEKEVLEMEKEMWDMFYGAGFWRSPSQKGDDEYSAL